MELAKELKEKNRKLRDIHLRLEIYNRQADRIVIAQELFDRPDGRAYRGGQPRCLDRRRFRGLHPGFHL